jgi:hypothetical protein
MLDMFGLLSAMFIWLVIRCFPFNNGTTDANVSGMLYLVELALEN